MVPPGSLGSTGGGVEVGLLATVKKSFAYRAVRSQVARACPSDSWCEEGLAILVFDLVRSEQDRAADAMRSLQAVFAVVTASKELVAAKVLEFTSCGEVVLVHDLLSENCAFALKAHT